MDESGMTRQQKARFVVLMGINDKYLELLDQIDVIGEKNTPVGARVYSAVMRVEPSSAAVCVAIAKVSPHLCKVHCFASC